MPGPVWEQNAKESRVGIGRCSTGHENRRADYTQSSTDKKERKGGRKRYKNEGEGREEKERAGKIGEDSRGEEKTDYYSKAQNYLTASQSQWPTWWRPERQKDLHFPDD